VKNANGQRIFAISKGEKILSTVVLINLFVLCFSMFAGASYSIDDSRVFSTARSTNAAVIYTERETLVFTTKFAQWLAGDLPKREVEIARALLARRLSVINEDGTSAGERVSTEFLNQLVDSDALLDKAPDGRLPVALREKLTEDSSVLIDGLVFNSRQIVITYQREFDANFANSIESRRQNTFYSLLVLISFVVLALILALWGRSTFKRQYALARKTLHDEEEALNLAKIQLKESELRIKKLEEMDISKSDFISTVNHELRTPLTSIIGYIDILKTLDTEKDLKQLPQITTVIDRNSEVLLDIIESILSLSSLDSPDQIPRFEKVHLIEIVERKIFVLTPLIHEKSLTVNFHHDFIDDFIILGNAGQLSQVVLNLLSNAIKFSPNNSVIDVSLSVVPGKNSKDFIELVFKDHGIGIPKEDIPNLFTRFFRASNAVSSQIVGTGLGLAIVARILNLHQSSIRVESEVNQGSSFIVSFPQYESETQLHVAKNRSSVLYKAIVALKASEPEQLIDVCHQMSSTVGFYNLEKEMHLIADLQAWLEANPEALRDLALSKKEEVIFSLEDSYAALDIGVEKQS
jgi:signal transduction histidine kinase